MEGYYWKRIYLWVILFCCRSSLIFCWLSPSPSSSSSKSHSTKTITTLSPKPTKTFIESRTTRSASITKLFESNVSGGGSNENDEAATTATSSSSMTNSSSVLVRDSSENEKENDDEEIIDTNNNEEENDEASCLPPGRDPEIKRIFLISDATGVMSRSMLLKSLAQFDTCSDERAPYATKNNKHDNNEDGNSNNNDMPSTGRCDVQTRTFTFVRSIQTLSQILNTAKDKNACVMYTIAEQKLRDHASEVCQQLNIPHVDLIGPTLNVLSEFLDEEPLGIPALFTSSSRSSDGSSGERRSSKLGDSYYQRIDAVEFCLKADDGQAPWLLPEADIVLVGVSRSGKTPLSVVLSQTMSLKVANIPLVMEVPPPIQLIKDVDPRRVFCLTISPSELRRIRTNRLERRGVKDMEAKIEKDINKSNIVIPKSNYADRSYILKDLSSVRQLCAKYNWTEVDVTGRAVEETATDIVEMFNQRFLGSDDNESFSNQHIG
jgi:regulator of PEP synthase PpsR (kinase-PPPase family)